MKSLAHPEWPYTGTPNEWRGFAVCRPLNKEERELIQKSRLGGEMPKTQPMPKYEYQKLNFGPELK